MAKSSGSSRSSLVNDNNSSSSNELDTSTRLYICMYSYGYEASPSSSTSHWAKLSSLSRSSFSSSSRSIPFVVRL